MRERKENRRRVEGRQAYRNILICKNLVIPMSLATTLKYSSCTSVVVCKLPNPYSNFNCCNTTSSIWQRHPRDSQLWRYTRNDNGRLGSLFTARFKYITIQKALFLSLSCELLTCVPFPTFRATSCNCCNTSSFKTSVNINLIL